jgi:hypothetical protein
MMNQLKSEAKYEGVIETGGYNSVFKGKKTEKPLWHKGFSVVHLFLG